MPDNPAYQPREHWDEIGRASAPGTGDSSGRFGTGADGNSLYRLPSWSAQPQYWEYMKSDHRILDIGSGNGLQVGRLLQRGMAAVGCDISHVLLSVAKGNMLSHGLNETPLVQWDGFRLPFASSTFDRITTNTVLQHVVDDSAVDDIFSEACRVLKGGGLFLVCELVAPQDMQTAPHVKLRSVQTYQDIASRYGFQMRKVRHAMSTYVTLQSLYGRFNTGSSAAANRESLHSPTENYHIHNSQSVGLASRKYLRYLISILAKLADHLIIFLHLGDKFAGQDEMIFEKRSLKV